MPRVYEATCDIPAPQEAVWAILADFPAYGEWNPFTPSVRTDLVIGGPVKMRVRLGRLTIPQTEWLREVTPPWRIVWAMDIGLPWLIGAERVQTVEALPGGGCRYTTVDTIFGLLSPVVEWLLGGALRVGFEQVVAGLRARALDRAPGGAAGG